MRAAARRLRDVLRDALREALWGSLAGLAAAWRDEMTLADRVRVLAAAAFPLGALLHLGWVFAHGWLYYAPGWPWWAPLFWYTLCVVDLFMAWLLLARPRAGLAAGLAMMALTLWVNWTKFPTFEHGFNLVLVGLTVFGAALSGVAPWLWAASRWRIGWRRRGRAEACPARARPGSRAPR